MPASGWDRRIHVRSVPAVLALGLLLLVLGAQVARGAAPSGPSPLDPDHIRELLGAGRFAEAESLARARLAGMTQQGRGDSLSGAQTLDLIVEVLRRSGKATYPETREIAERALALKERLLGPEDLEVAASANGLGAVLLLSGDMVRSRQLFERVVAIRVKALGPEHILVARGLNNVGESLRRGGDYVAARPIVERALAIKQKLLGPEDPDVLMTRNNLGLLLHQIGECTASRAILEENLRLREKALGPDHPDVAQSLTNLGDLLREMGELTDARGMFERALAIREKLYGRNNPEVATTLIDLGIVHQLLSDFTAARRIYDEAVAALEGIPGPELPELGAALNDVASLQQTRGDLEGARDYFSRALRVQEKTLGPDNFDVGQTTANLGAVLMGLGRRDSAALYLNRGIAILEKAVGSDHAEVARVLMTQAELMRRSGALDEAQVRLERAVAIFEKSYGPRHPELASALATEAALLAQRSDRRRALALALRAEAIGRDYLSLMACTLPERQALQFAAYRSGGLDLALSLADSSLAAGSQGGVLDAVIRSRALVLDEMAARAAVLAEARDSAASRRLGDLANASQRLANLVVRGPDPSHPERFTASLEEARRGHETAEQALALLSAGFRRQRARSNAGLGDVAKALSPGDALVSYVRYDASSARPAGSPDSAPGPRRGYLAFVLLGGRAQPDVVPLGVACEVDSLVAAWSREAGRTPAESSRQRDEARCRSRGASLRQRIWDPVARHIQGARRVFIVPDGSIDRVSFVGLPSEGAGYLVEGPSLIHYLSAERDLLPAESQQRGQGLLALGAPDFDAATEAPIREPVAVAADAGGAAGDLRGNAPGCLALRSVRFAPLPATREEVEEVARSWNLRRGPGEARASAVGDSATILTGSGATESAFKTYCPGRRVLHLATHGFDCGSPSAGGGRGIGLGVPTSEAPRIPQAYENLLRLSGLALARANHRAEIGISSDDGILTAQEVASLDLAGVEWAVLSACDTGLGEIQSGEGVLGLRRAFQIAGARTVVMSLWSVSDEATRRWMAQLYRGRFDEHLTTAEAVRGAALAVLRERRALGLSTHPFYWAAFAAVGDWR